MPPVSVFLGLGSNINPEANLRSAADLLRSHWPGVRFSHVYRSKAREVENQDDFLNAVAVIETDESPQTIADHLHAIEKQLKKSPPFKFGPRTIDLDLLLYGDLILPSREKWPHESTNQRVNELTIPHPRMHERRFVLEPLCELIDPKARHPVLDSTWKELLQKTMDQDCRRAGFDL